MHKDNTFETLKSYWVIIIFAGSMIVSWTTMTATQAQQDEAIDKNSLEIREISKAINKIDVRLGSIDTKLDYIKEKINQ